jgi:tetratricopeptide (TPR) repeat protein
MFKYHARHYDIELRLKIPAMLWLGILFGTSHLFCFAALKFIPQVADTFTWLNSYSHVYLLLGDLPALAVLIATGHRVPNALKLMRRVWLNGRWLLASSFIANGIIFLYLNSEALFNSSNPNFGFKLFVLLLQGLMLGYLLRSGLVRDVFNELPDETDGKGINNLSAPKVRRSTDQLKQDLARERIEASRDELLRVRIFEMHGEDLQLQPSASHQEMMQYAAQFESKGHFSKAEQVYRSLLSSSPELAIAWHALGLLAFHSSKSEQALDGKASLFRRNLCEMYRRMGHVQKAISIGRIACRMAPKDADAYFNLGLALTDARSLKEAMLCYREAVKINPDHGQCWNNLGVVLGTMGDTEGARDAFNHAISTNSSNADAHKNLQSLLANSGNTGKSSEQVQPPAVAR